MKIYRMDVGYKDCKTTKLLVTNNDLFSLANQCYIHNINIVNFFSVVRDTLEKNTRQ